jgi:ethanolamine-phosphate cytidylyltransferase
MSSPITSVPPSPEKLKARGNHPIRIWCDGCWDLWHYGHANALRQAKLCGDVLVVGVHSDEEIIQHKGIPVMKYEERIAMVSACKWVDEIVLDAPYQTMLSVLEANKIDYCVHGEDISTTADGTDSFAEVKAAGRFKLIKRTGGISTTDIVGRMLLSSKRHFAGGEESGSVQWGEVGSVKQFLTTSRKIVQFSSAKAPKPTDKIVYCAGAFDLLHPGHVEFLQKAKSFGDFLIVGVYTDKDINDRKGECYPIMNIHERTLTVLSTKFVDEVIIGAPFHVSKYMVDLEKIQVVVHSSIDDVGLLPDEPDPYREVKELGIYQEVQLSYKLTTSDILQRIIKNRLEYETRNTKKVEKDKKVAEGITFIPEEIDVHNRPSYN